MWRKNGRLGLCCRLRLLRSIIDLPMCTILFVFITMFMLSSNNIINITCNNPIAITKRYNCYRAAAANLLCGNTFVIRHMSLELRPAVSPSSADSLLMALELRPAVSPSSADSLLMAQSRYGPPPGLRLGSCQVMHACMYSTKYLMHSIQTLKLSQ